MDIIGEAHIVSGLRAILEVGIVCLRLQRPVFANAHIVGHHLYLPDTGNGIRCLVDLVDRVIAGTEQGEAVIFQTQDVETLEGVEDFRVVDGVRRETVARDIGAAESLCIREMAVAEDAAFAVVFIEDIFSDALQSCRRRGAAVVEVFVLQGYVAIGVHIVGHRLLVVVMLVVIPIEVGAIRQCHRSHVLTRDGDMFAFLTVANEHHRVAAEAHRCASW